MPRPLKIVLVILAIPAALVMWLPLLMIWSFQEHGRTPLHTAAENNNAAFIRVWSSLHLPMNLPMHSPSTLENSGNGGVTPLMLAAERGNAEAVQALLAGGADPTLELDRDLPGSEHGQTALYFAAYGGNPVVMQALLKAWAPRPLPDYRHPYLDVAMHSLCGDLGTTLVTYYYVIKRSLEDRRKLADLIYSDMLADEASARLLSGQHSVECAEQTAFWLDHGAPPSSQMMLMAIDGRRLDLLQRMIDEKVDVNQNADFYYRGIGNITPLSLASHMCQLDAVEALLGAGANPNTVGPSGKAALHYAASGERECADVVRLLVSHGGRSDTKDASGKTPVDYVDQNNRSMLAALGLVPQDASARSCVKISDDAQSDASGKRTRRVHYACKASGEAFDFKPQR